MNAKITFQIVKSIGNLTANFEELKKSVTESVAKYRGLVYTEDQITEAKSDLAFLRAERKRIDDARKSVKKEFMNPYEQFESQVKETLAIYDSAIVEIDAQVKAAEEAEKAKKKIAIEEWWKENGVKSVTGIKLAQVWDERYLNKTYTEKKWQEDLTKKVQRIEDDLTHISLMGTAEMINFVTPMYMKTLNLSEAIKEYDQFKENQRKTEEARRRAEEARKAREEQERQWREKREAERLEMERKAREEAERMAQETAQKPVTIVAPSFEEKPAEQPVETTETIYTMTFSIEGNHDAVKELCDLLRTLKANGGLTFKVLEKGQR